MKSEIVYPEHEAKPHWFEKKTKSLHFFLFSSGGGAFTSPSKGKEIKPNLLHLKSSSWYSPQNRTAGS